LVGGEEGLGLGRGLTRCGWGCAASLFFCRLFRELSQLQAQAAKQADIHAAVGEMTLGPQRLVAANESLSAELGRVQRGNERRQVWFCVCGLFVAAVGARPECLSRGCVHHV
jgi:hypothetical protein